MFSLFFIRRPIFATVISLVIVLLGLFAMISLPVERYPDIAPPTINVSAVYPGADAKTVADTVAAPIEQQVNGVENMLYMTSVCGNDGSMNLTVTFETGTDLDTANVLTQNRVSAAESSLPQEVQRMGINVKKKSTGTAAFIAFYSPDERFDDLFISNYVNLRVKDELARVNGVGEVQVFGVGDYSMRLWLDPQKLKARGLAAEDVVNAVRDQNVQVAAGQIGASPAENDQSFEYTVNVKGRLVDVEEFKDIVIRTSDAGGLLRIRDIARVELGSSSYNFSSAMNGTLAATVAIYQIPGANSISVLSGLEEKLEGLKEGFPEGLDYRIVYDSTDIIKASMREVIITLCMTLILVVLTVYIFLQNLRATIIPAVTIPMALIGTFAVMAGMGFSINQFTLFGLVLVIGIVVDDAIVVVENCSRHLNAGGVTPREAAEKAMIEVSGPVIATTLVLLAVFVPTSFMTGITGLLFRQFALTISVATVFSSINALTLSPALCGVILRPDKGGERQGFFGLFNRFMEKTTSRYTGVVQLALRRAALGVLVFVGLSTVAFMGFSKLPGGFVPQEDEGYCMISLQLPPAASRERLDGFVDEVEQVIGSVEGIENYLTISGFSILDNAAISSAGFAVVVMKDWSERDDSRHQDKIIGELNMKLSRLQDGLAFAFPMPSLPGVGVSGGMSMQVQDRQGVGLESLEQTTRAFMADGMSQSAIAGLNTTFRANVPQLFVDIDRDQVLAKQVPLSSVFSGLQYYLGSVYINDLTLYNRVFQVKAQADAEFRGDPMDIGRLEVRNSQGKMVPLGALIKVEDVLGPQTVNRHNMYPAIKVMGQPAPGFSSGQAMDLVENMAATKLPESVGLEWTELSFQEKAAGGTSVIFLLAVILVYLTLAAQYESWSIPISVVLAVPTALLGAVVALMSRGMANDVYAQVGVVLLIGLSTKSAILIAEFAKQQRDEGRSVFDAAMDSARLRFRAVLMTALSFVLGVIPLVVATGAGAESRKVLGSTVLGGMLVATVVSLVCVPMLYYVIQLASEKSSKKSDTA